MRLGYFFGKALGDIGENKVTYALSTGTIAACFFLFSAFLLVAQNFESFLEVWEKKVQVILYLKDGVPEPRVLELQERLMKDDAVEAVRYVSKKEAKELFEHDLGGYGGILEGLQEELFPASLEIQVAEAYRTPERMRMLGVRFSGFFEVDEAQYGGIWLERLSLLLYILKWGAWVLAGILIVVVVSVTANTVRLMLYNRRSEIEIMRLVGASEVFVSTPFCIEGGIQAVSGAAVSLLLLFMVYYVFSLQISPYLSSYFGRLHLSFLTPQVMIMILVVGIGSGLLGGVFSLRRRESA
jgi:cell division transport system permease protein